LIEYLNGLPLAERDPLCRECGTSENYVRKAASTGQLLSPAVCVRFERHTQKAVRRWDLRPDDWADIWPELAGTKGAPDLAVAAKAA